MRFYDAYHDGDGYVLVRNRTRIYKTAAEYAAIVAGGWYGITLYDGPAPEMAPGSVEPVYGPGQSVTLPSGVEFTGD